MKRVHAFRRFVAGLVLFFGVLDLVFTLEAHDQWDRAHQINGPVPNGFLGYPTLYGPSRWDIPVAVAILLACVTVAALVYPRRRALPHRL